MALVRAFSTSTRRSTTTSLKQGLEGKFGIVPNKKKYERLMKLQSEWNVISFSFFFFNNFCK